MDFWVWIVILVIAWLLEAVGSKLKKNRQPPDSLMHRESEQPPAIRPTPPRKIFLPDDLIELADALVERREEEHQLLIEGPVRRTSMRPRDEEIAEKPLEGVSAEVVDRTEAPAPELGVAQHLRALEKYGSAQGTAAEPVAARRRLVLRPGTLREAILWTEILGRPKGW